MDKEELIKRIAYLESLNDQIAAELDYVDQLLRTIGFPDGLDSVKVAANEMMDYYSYDMEDPFPFNEEDPLSR